MNELECPQNGGNAINKVRHRPPELHYSASVADTPQLSIHPDADRDAPITASIMTPALPVDGSRLYGLPAT